MKMWRTKLKTDIDEVDVVKKTDKQIVWLSQNGKEIREAKFSEHYSFHETKLEAINYLIQLHNSEIEAHCKSIDYIKEKIYKIKNKFL